MKGRFNALRTMVVALLVWVSAPFGAMADFTLSDLWFSRTESGWGANIIQQEGILFVTIFVYGTDGRPTWYVAPATVKDAASRFNGPLYVTNGPYFGGASFNPSAVTNRQVGTLTVDPVCATCNVHNAMRFSYTVDGVSVTKSLERQTWAAVSIPSVGFGALRVISGSNCAGYPQGPLMFTFTYAANVLTLTDSAGVRYTVNIGGQQYGTGFYAGSFSVSGAPALTGSGIAVTVVGGRFDLVLVGVGAGGCSVAYTVIGAGNNT